MLIPVFSCEMNLMNLIHSLLLKTNPTSLPPRLLTQPKDSGCVHASGNLCSLVTFAQVGGPATGKVVALSVFPEFLSPSYSPGVQEAPVLPSKHPLPVPGN